MTAFALRFATVALACSLGMAEAAHARGAFDGSWTVDITGRSGTCDGVSTSYGVSIINNIVRYNGGDATISGTVSPSGALTVHVSSGGNTAGGSGKLSSRSGRGNFRGSSSSGPCSGVWSAVRTGG
jgi:hypothetical protein